MTVSMRVAVKVAVKWGKTIRTTFYRGPNCLILKEPVKGLEPLTL
jgi:hypothetical protein